MRGLTLNSPALVARATPESGGGGGAAPEAMNFTTSSTSSSPRAVALPTYAVGDCVVSFCMVSFSIGSSPTFPTAGPNGETIVPISSPKGVACYFIATAAGATTINYQGSSGFATEHLSFRIPAGNFDPEDPIYNVTSAVGSGTTATSGAWNSVFTTGVVIAVGAFETSAPTAITSGWTQNHSSSGSGFVKYLASRTATTVNGAEATVTITKAATQSNTILFVLNPAGGSVCPGVPYSASTGATIVGDTIPPPGIKINSFYVGSTLLNTFPQSFVGSGGSPVTGMRVEYKKTIDSTWSVASTNATSLPYQFAVPEGGVSYNVRFMLINGSGESTVVSSFETFVGVPPDQVAATYTVTAKSGYIAFTNITDPAAYGNPVQSYKIRYRVSGSGTWLDAATQGLDYNISLNGAAAGDKSGYLFGLTNSTTYEVAIAAVNAIGTGPYSTTYTVTPVLSAAHANDAGATTYTEYPLRVWLIAPNNFNNDAEALQINRSQTSANVGTSPWSGDDSGTYVYHIILEYDTSTQSGTITAGNVSAPVINLAAAGANHTIELYSSGPSFNPNDTARVSTDSITQTELASYTHGAALDVTGLSGNQTMTKNGFNLGAVSGGSARTYIRMTTNNHRTGTSFDAVSQVNPWLCPLSFKVA